MLSRGIVLIVGLGAGMVTARLLGPEGRGFYYLAITWVALAIQFGSLGGPAGIVWLRRNHGAAGADLLGTSALQSLVAGMAAAALILLCAASLGVVGATDFRIWPAVFAATVGGLFFQLAASLMLADGQARRYNAVQITNSVVTAALVSVAAWWFADPLPAVYAAAAGALITAAVSGGAAGRGQSGPWRVNVGLLRLGAAFSGRIFLTTALSFAAQRVSVIVLAKYSNAEQVGYYAVSAQICDALLAVPASVGALLFPTLVARGALDWKRARRTLLWTAGAVAVLASVIALAAPYVLNGLFGHRFGDATSVTRHLLPSVVLLSGSTILSQYIAAGGAPLAAALPWAGGIAVGAIWCALVAPSAGALGAADSQIGANALALAGLWIVARTVRRSSAATSEPAGVHR